MSHLVFPFFPLNEWIKKLHWFTVWPSATLQAQYTVLPLRLERRGRTLTGFLTQQVHELQKQWKNVNTGQRSHWAVWLACPYFVFLVQLHSLLVFSNESAFPAFKNDEKLHNACWMKNTVAIVCSTQKDGDDALLKASVYVRLQFTNLEMCVFFPYLPPLLLPFFFLPLIWFREQCETHCCSSVYCNYYRSHCLTLKGCVQVVELN